MTSISYVTMTGADESVDPAALIALSRAYPWVEWGILVSAPDHVGPRFPSIGWIERLLMIAAAEQNP